MKTILIGPTGFLGENFLRLYPEIISVGRKNSFNEANEFIQIGSDLDFSILDDLVFDNAIFLIGSSDHQVINNHSTLAYEMNVLPLSKFLFYCSQRHLKPKTIITFTTMLQYNTSKMKTPCNEKQPINPYSNNYVLSKVMAEQISQLYRKFFNIVDIRLSNVFGPTHLRRPDLIPTILHQALSEISTISVWTKKPIRDFVYVNDVVSAVMSLLSTSFSGPINIGSGIGRSVGEVCDIIESLCNKKIVTKGITVSGHMKYIHDLTLLKSLISFIPTNLEKGLENTFEYMKHHYTN